jgi:hypothetical protein
MRQVTKTQGPSVYAYTFGETKHAEGYIPGTMRARNAFKTKVNKNSDYQLKHRKELESERFKRRISAAKKAKKLRRKPDTRCWMHPDIK